MSDLSAEKVVAELRRAIMTGEDGCGTLPAREAVKVRPADWHRITKLGRQAADLIAQQAARLEEADGRHANVLSAYDAAVADAVRLKDANTALRRVIEDGEAALTAAEAEVGRLKRATTPSPATKAAYVGEFHFDWTVWAPNGDEQITHRVQVPWTTIKQIMAAIRARACLSSKKEG